MGRKTDFPAPINKALVTGGGGFVGRALVKRLLGVGVKTSVIGRHRYPEIEKWGGQCTVGDISDFEPIADATKNVDIVFHVAALAGIWGKWDTYYRSNVIGTQNVIKACRKNAVPMLVYTSTPSVVFNGCDLKGEDETLPYASNPLCFYAKSKIIAEQLIRNAASDTLKTCALRPHLIWGPEDPHLIPRLLRSGREGRLKRVGPGNNLVDITYIDNAAHAHILAAINLAGNASANGKAYFISQGEPVNLWQWIYDLFKMMDVPPVTEAVSQNLAYAVGGTMEFFYTIFGRADEPKMTRFVAEQLAKSHYFSIANARNDLGYEPIVSIEEGLHRTVQWLKSK